MSKLFAIYSATLNTVIW